MFERLAGKLLGNFLSKYFTEESLAKNKVSTSTQLGVWSGYISLQNLELKKDVINSKLRRKGQPFEIVHCSFRQVEITIPWAKLSNPINNSPSSDGSEEDAVVVVVLDGIHLMVRTSFDFHDLAMREEEIRQRQTAFLRAESLGKEDEEPTMSYTEMLKKRVTEGLLQEIVDKLHVHIRDLHIRVEDTESDPQNPYAFGVTMESMHIQHDDEGEAADGVISKVSQLNHIAAYWNALEYGHGLPVENSVLHETCRGDSERLSRALNFCIARRASMIASPSRNPYIPTHTYILMPVDGAFHGHLSTKPNDLSSKPALVIVITVEPISAQIRDFQCVQILRLAGEIKTHKFIKKYRKFRPLVLVKDNPRAWWLYAARVIRYQLKESFLRWSWSRFTSGYQTRGRYMELYERKVRFPSRKQAETLSSLSSNIDETDILNRSRQPPVVTNTAGDPSDTLNGTDKMYATPDEGAGPSISVVSEQNSDQRPLNQSELVEFQNLEDGLHGDLSVNDIILYRAVVNMRLGRTMNESPERGKQSSWWRSTVEGVAVDDSEAKEEFDRLLLFLDKSSNQAYTLDAKNRSHTAMSIMIRLEQISIALLSPLHLTRDETQLRRLHEKFLEFSIVDVRLGYSIKGDYQTCELQLSIFDLIGTEVRADQSQHVIANQVSKENQSPNNSVDTDQIEQNNPLFVVTLAKYPPTIGGCDLELVVFVNTIEIKLIPDCEWISHIKDMLDQLTRLPNVADFWGDLSLAYINSLALGRLGLRAKAESAAYENKNMDIEITIQCPIVRIGDGTGCDLIVDLGIAHFRTEKLAGMASTKLHHLPVLDSGNVNLGTPSVDRFVASIDDGSVIGSIAAPTLTSKSRFELPSPRRTSAFSVDSRNQNTHGNRSVSGSLYFDDTVSFSRFASTGGRKGKEADNLHAFFYDVYELRLQTGKVTFSGETEVFDISSGFEVSTTLKKSVLPSDHTICKLKAHTVVGNLNVELNERVIIHVEKAIQTWKALMGVSLYSRSPERRQPVPSGNLQHRNYVVSHNSTTSLDFDHTDEGSLSQIDENEFFDANEGYESISGENSGMWFDDNWISDAESFIDGDNRSLQNERRRRRRAHSISDVSSASDQSTKGRRAHPGNDYLSAENLARLEERPGEDESLGESVIEMDDDSFHSVMSAGGQIELLGEIDTDVKKGENTVLVLIQKLDDLQRAPVSETTQSDQKHWRKQRRALKLELNRTNAELNALRALYGDLDALITEIPNNSTENGDMDHVFALTASRLQQAKHTKALLEAKKKRDAMLESNGSHNLTRDLNREIFQGSLLFNQLQITIQLGDGNQDESSRTASSVFEVVASQTGIALFHYANETKLYFSLDQITAAVRSKVTSQTPTRLLLSGGSSDTLLPSHFPHLISRSMEERFLRGALHIGKRRAIDTFSQLTRTFKLRLILGDIEVSPSQQYLAPLSSFFSNLDIAPVKSSTPNNDATTANSHDERVAGAEPSSSGLNATCDKSSKYYDLALRLTSIRVVLSRANQIVGASAVTETAVRFIQVSSPLRNRVQLDLRCSNLQLLEVVNFEAGRGSEIAGRRDPYSSLVHLRLRSQVVPSFECGGWVIGLDNRKVENDPIRWETAVKNVHVGIKCNAISLVASPEAIARIVESARELKRFQEKKTKTSPDDYNSDYISKPNSKNGLLAQFSGTVPLRWRADVSLRRVAIIFPEKSGDEWNITDDVGSKMLAAFTVVTCFQESDVRQGCISLHLGLTELSLIRSSDDWPILESFSFICDSCIESKLFAKDVRSVSGVECPQLQINAESPLNEIAAVFHRYGWDSIPIREAGYVQLGLRAKMTPVRANFSAPVIGLLVETMHSLKVALVKIQKGENAFGQADTSPTGPSLSGIATSPPTSSARRYRRRKELHVLLEHIEFQVLREADSKPISFAEPLVSFTLADARVDYEQGEQTTASVLIRNSSLFDLSSARGVRVIGEDPAGYAVDNPFFVRVKLYMDRHLDGPKTIRLEINWGSIQCLVMPSFLKSLLSLQDDVKSTLGIKRQDRSEQPKKDTLAQVLVYPSDINLILSAHAEAFECIVSSKDIVEYVRQSETEPIGVVTFRWKASLSVSLALDCLSGSSVPWLTLNLDGNFTDPKDTNLFKDFANRYLAQSSGLLAGSEEIGHKLLNAFTAKVNLSVSNFQALRTTISAMQLKSSPKTVGLSYKSVHRIYFSVIPPPVGEQRITNPIDLDLTYRAVGASMSRVSTNEKLHPQVEISQLVQLKANFVDVLLYISQSSGGFTEAFKVTVKPVLDLLKQKDARRVKDDIEVTESQLEEKNQLPTPTLASILRNASSMCMIQLEGFQVTCVPGGATRLNESPIIKFELSQFALGLGAVPVPKDVHLVSGRAKPRRGSSRNVLSGCDVMHLTTAGWVSCQITGHYHNRRLVAWEPFIEPWQADFRFGADLVEVLGMASTMKMELGQLNSAAESHQNGLDSFHSGSHNEGAGDRLRDFGRLFRAPFQSASSSKRTENGSVFISHTDFCYLMLASTARTTLLSILYPTTDSKHDMEARVFTSLPGRGHTDWLRGFGLPGFLRNDGQESFTDQYSFSCLLSDTRPLNINVTGALIENVLGYVDTVKKDGFRSVAPHWIRNDTGMTIRFQEVVDVDRVKQGVQAGKTTVSNGVEVPLILKRSLSQSCDPHRAYIHLELGSFEDTVGRIKHDDFEIPKGSRSSTFFFKAAAKIPVDTVGVHRYPLDRNLETRAEIKALAGDSRALGWIIVRVALRGGIKVVSVESPFVLKSTADADLLCEVRDHNGISLLWRCLVPKSEDHEHSEKPQELVSVPADIVPFLHDGSYRFSVMALSRVSSLDHEAEFVSPVSRHMAIEISTPPPFSPQSFSKGLIREEEVSLSTLAAEASEELEVPTQGSENVHLTTCSVRIGSFSGVKTAVEVPEQRMIFFRAPLVIRNFLALPIAVQVRVKVPSQAVANANASVVGTRRDQAQGRRSTVLTEWEDLGVLDCGQSVKWTGALSSDRVQLRVRFVGIDGDNSRRFPGWSSAVFIPTRDRNPREATRVGKPDRKVFAQMRVSDADKVPMPLSVALEGGNSSPEGDPTIDENIRLYSETFSHGTRVVSIFVPYWIVDGTNEDLEFFSGAPVAGQLDNRVQGDVRGVEEREKGTTLGLAELLDNDNFLHLPSRASFVVMMIGDESSTRLTVRKRLARKSRRAVGGYSSPWSDPIPLQAEQNSQHDITVLAPKESSTISSADSDDPRGFDRFVLRSSIVSAPESFGGALGTKLIHVVNRYSIVNETGRDIEIVSDYGRGSNVLVRAARWAQPFHFDDSRPVRFRFKEFGWTWSGKFNIRLNRREVTMRLRHKIKGHTVIVTVEVVERKKTSTSVIIFRQSTHPPFRLENHTMYPLNFGQASSRVGSEESDVDAMLLPYQNADFAWDEPELRRRALIVKSTDSSELPEGFVLGRFHLDQIAPGTILKLESVLFAGEIVADGPTRVLRITDASMPRLSSFRQDELNDFQQTRMPTDETSMTMSLLVKLSHGIGVSIVDWSPQELLYARLDDIQIERKVDSKKEAVSLAIGNIKLNNQLWVTPYPVLLKMGKRFESSISRRRNRRHDALSLSWRRSLNNHGGYCNLTLLEQVELSSEPVFVNVDGKLAGLLFRMVQQVAGIGSDGNRNKSLSSSRDDGLRQLLDLAEDNPADDDSSSRRILSDFEHGSDGGLMTTAAIAAKLKVAPLPLVTTIQSGFHSVSAVSRKEKNVSLSKPQHKYYIEKLRISATKADLSWSGPLPGLVSSLLLRALTFERLPLRLRPYSSSHAYGNAKDHLQSLKSHYVSFWRILDLLMGLSYNPTFLFRAIVYTCRETCSSNLDSFSYDARKIAKDVIKILPTEMEFQPTYDDGLPLQEVIPRSMVLKHTILRPFVRGVALFFNGSSLVTDWMSSLLKYGPHSGKHLLTRGLVRSRNPRLFAQMDGKDLLVEYVEGENAGKALLSRVRMGMHLGEGYIFHTEGTRQSKMKPMSSTDLDPSPLIFMITSERTLLLNGKLNQNFCSVVWEAMFVNIIHVEMIPQEERASSFDQLVIWYLSDAEFAAGNPEDKNTMYSKALVAAGVDVLHCKSVFVPSQTGKQLLAKMGGVEKRLMEVF